MKRIAEGEPEPLRSSGLGLFLTQHHRGGLVVNALAPGGAAERSGQIKVGDVVVAVCGVSTKDMKPAEVKKS